MKRLKIGFQLSENNNYMMDSQPLIEYTLYAMTLHSISLNAHNNWESQPYFIEKWIQDQMT